MLPPRVGSLTTGAPIASDSTFTTARDTGSSIEIRDEG